jgi:hypothetical protein
VSTPHHTTGAAPAFVSSVSIIIIIVIIIMTIIIVMIVVMVTQWLSGGNACVLVSFQDRLSQETKDTPLQEKLDDMANFIGSVTH